MAEFGSSSSDTPSPPSHSSVVPPPAQHDWEVLSMSMSASALGNPQPASGNETGDIQTNPTEPSAQVESFVSEGELEVLNPGFRNGAFISELLTDASVSRDGGDMVAEAFTEGRKPQLSSSDVYSYGTDHGYGEHVPQEESLFSGQSESHVNASQVVLDATRKEAAASDTKVLLHPHSDEMKSDHGLKVVSKHQSRKSRGMWSMAVVVTVVGIAVLGYHWRLECCRNQKLQLDLSAKDEKLNDLLHQVNRLKEAIGGYQKVPVPHTV